MSQEALFAVGDEVQWKRQDLDKMQVDCLLHCIEDLELIGPFRITRVDEFPPSSFPKPNERLVMVKDQKTGKEKQFSTFWFEKFAG
jgi:hypothetical protein